MIVGFDGDRLNAIIKKLSQGTLAINDFTSEANAVHYILNFVEREIVNKREETPCK